MISCNHFPFGIISFQMPHRTKNHLEKKNHSVDPLSRFNILVEKKSKTLLNSFTGLIETVQSEFLNSTVWISVD